MDYCLFLSTETWDPASIAIRWFTDCEWSHCGFYRLADGWTYSAEFLGGVDWRKPNPRARVLKLSTDGIDAALSKALSVKGSAYDMLDIIGIATSHDWAKPGDFICDKLVFWAFNQIGTPLVNPNYIPLEHLTPRDLLLSPYVNEIS